MKRFALLGALVLTGITLWAAVAHEHGLAHILGIDTQQSQEYDFVSGVGPMLVTALLGGSVIVSLVHHVNCHHEGCWRIGRHKVHGTPWCNVHHAIARPERTQQEILTSIEGSLAELVTLLKEGR